MGEDCEPTAGDSGSKNDDGDGTLGGLLLMIGFLDLLLVGLALYVFSLGEPAAGAGILALALLLTGVDVALYRRGSF